MKTLCLLFSLTLTQFAQAEGDWAIQGFMIADPAEDFIAQLKTVTGDSFDPAIGRRVVSGKFNWGPKVEMHQNRYGGIVRIEAVDYTRSLQEAMDSAHGICVSYTPSEQGKPACKFDTTGEQSLLLANTKHHFQISKTEKVSDDLSVWFFADVLSDDTGVYSITRLLQLNPYREYFDREGELIAAERMN